MELSDEERGALNAPFFLSLSHLYLLLFAGFVPNSSNCLVPRELNYDPLTAVRNEASTYDLLSAVRNETEIYDLLPAVPNKVKSSCLRNAFSDIVLVIVYNFPLYSSIPTLSGLYKNAFPTIMFCGAKESKEHNVEWVGHIFRGYFGYACMSRAMEKYPAYEGYLLIGDDVILNYWNLIEMDRNKIWEGPKVPILSEYTQPEKWSWWNSIYGKSSCQKAYEEIWVLYNSSTTETLSTMSSLSVNGTGHSRGVLGNIKGSIDLSKQNRNWTFLCPRGRSDIFYLPRKFADEFKTLSHIFHKYRTFLEIAVPAICRIIDKEDNFEDIPGIYMPGVGDKQSEFLWRIYNPTLAFIHPFKLGYEHDGALNKAMLKNWIMEFSNLLNTC